MAGEITNDVLAERLDQLRRDQHEDLLDIKAQLALLVPREVYEAHRFADTARIVALEKRADDADAARKKEAADAAERQRAIMRWVIGAIAVPIIVLILNLYFSTHPGVKP